MMMIMVNNDVYVKMMMNDIMVVVYDNDFGWCIMMYDNNDVL